MTLKTPNEMTFPSDVMMRWQETGHPTILYNRTRIMLVYEGKIKLRLFSHAPTSLFAHSYMLLHLHSFSLALFSYLLVMRCAD